MELEREERLMDALWAMFQRRWALDKLAWRSVSEDLNLTELRCIEYVGSHKSVNSTRLAGAFFMTTGATSKLTKRLLAKGLLERYQKPENRKEVYFHLSDTGNHLFTTLSALRQTLRHRDAPIYETMTEEEYTVILRFVQRFNDHLRRMEKDLSWQPCY